MIPSDQYTLSRCRRQKTFKSHLIRASYNIFRYYVRLSDPDMPMGQKTSIVFRAYFKIALRMSANGADFRRLSAHYDMAAVAAFPNLDLALGKDGGRLHVFEQSAVSLLMMLFDCGYHAEFMRELVEALLLRSFGKAFLHICPLVVLALGSSGKIFAGIADSFKLLEPHFCMFLFVVRGF